MKRVWRSYEYIGISIDVAIHRSTSRIHQHDATLALYHRGSVLEKKLLWSLLPMADLLHMPHSIAQSTLMISVRMRGRPSSMWSTHSSPPFKFSKTSYRDLKDMGARRLSCSLFSFLSSNPLSLFFQGLHLCLLRTGLSGLHESIRPAQPLDFGPW